MFTFVARRLANGVAMLFVISSAAFLLLYLTGGDIARSIMGEFATEEAVRLRATQLGLDQPLLTRYWDWLSSALTGDFGTSWFAPSSVTNLVLTRLAVTLSLVGLAVLLIAVVATLLGVFAALNRGGLLDRFIQFFSLLGAAVPNFLIALAFIMVFSLQLGWLRPTGFVSPSTSIIGWLASVALPVGALVVAGTAASAQQIRGAMIDSLNQDYVRTLRARGLPTRSVVFKHALRNAAGPGLSILALQFVALLGGAIVIENLFALPGMGSLSVRSTVQGDIPVVMGVVVTIAIMVIVVNLIIDIVQGWLNPKVRVA